MEWIKIAPSNLPEGRVLVGCFDEDSPDYGEKIVGLLDLTCTNAWDLRGDIYIKNPTHYIDIDKHDPKG